MEKAWKFGVIALVALGLTVLPGGESALNLMLTLLTIIFLVAIAMLVYRLFRQYRIEIESLAPRLRLALYGSLALALLAFTATNRLFDTGGAGVVAWLAMLGLASYGLYFTWKSYRSYE